MDLGISGSRTITDFDFTNYFSTKDRSFAAFLSDFGFTHVDRIITGGAAGADSLAEAAAMTMSIPVVRIDPDFDKYHGRMRFAAFLNRDEKIVRAADAILVVWNGAISSHGTLYTMNAAIEDGVPVFLVAVKDGKIVSCGQQNEIIEYPKRKRWK